MFAPAYKRHQLFCLDNNSVNRVFSKKTHLVVQTGVYKFGPRDLLNSCSQLQLKQIKLQAEKYI